MTQTKQSSHHYATEIYIICSEAPEFTLSLYGVRVVQTLAFCVVFCGSVFVLLSVFHSPLNCLSFLLQFVITSLVS